MAHSIETHLNAIKAAADRASGTMRSQASAEANREAFKAFMADLSAISEALAYELGGDGAYISDEYIGITSPGGCVDSVFLDLIEAEERREPYQRPYSTLNHSQQGISQVAMFKPRAGLNADLVKGASFR
jgi:hypothetical protein